MTLRQLKKSLEKFTGDFLDMQIIIPSINSITNKREYDILSFVGYSECVPCIMMGGEIVTKKLVSEGVVGLDGKKIELPEDTDGEDWK